MVQAGGCGGETEIAERSPARRGAAATDAPCVVYKCEPKLRDLKAGQAVRVQAVAAARHVDLVLMAGTDERSFGGPEDRSRRRSQ